MSPCVLGLSRALPPLRDLYQDRHLLGKILTVVSNFPAIKPDSVMFRLFLQLRTPVSALKVMGSRPFIGSPSVNVRSR